MKVLVVFGCALVLARAGWVPINPVEKNYKGPQHFPKIHNGVPVETPEVQHAKAAHLAALAAASARPGYNTYRDEYHGCQDHHGLGCYSTNGYTSPAPVTPAPVYLKPTPVYHTLAPVARAPAPIKETPEVYTAPQTLIHPAYQTSNVLPTIAHNGRPLDTPEVEEAKQRHFAEFSKAFAATAPHQPEEPRNNYNGDVVLQYRHRRSISDFSDMNQNVPVEPMKLRKSHGYSFVQVHDPVYGVHYEDWTPKYDHYGHPLDIEEVEKLKQEHIQTHHVPATGPMETEEVAHAKHEH